MKTDSLVVIHGMVKQFEDFNGKLGRVLRENGDNTVMVYFPGNGIEIPSYCLGRVMNFSFKRCNLTEVERKAIVSQESSTRTAIKR